MVAFVDLTGKRFDRLLVIKRIANRMMGNVSRVFYLCKCDCGTLKEVHSGNLKQGHSNSCGCYQREMAGKRFRTHGLSTHTLYKKFSMMIQRCENPNNGRYHCYGGRDISICKEWRGSVEVFVKWALETGWKKGLAIDRIDNDGNYCPANCQWLTMSENITKAHQDKRTKNGV